MEEIVRVACPPRWYDFQFTLSNRNRPECINPAFPQQVLAGDRFQFPLKAFSGRATAITGGRKKSRVGPGAPTVTTHFNDIAENP